MFNSSDAELTTFATGYQEFINRSKQITNDVYSKDLEELDNNFIQKIADKFKDSPLLEKIKGFGENITENIVNGIESKSDWMKEQIIKFCESMSGMFNLGFNFETVSLDNADVGVLNDRVNLSNYQTDYSEHLALINDNIDRLISLVGEHLPNIDNKMNRPVMVDTDALAVGMSRKMDSQLGKITISKDRGNV